MMSANLIDKPFQFLLRNRQVMYSLSHRKPCLADLLRPLLNTSIKFELVPKQLGKRSNSDGELGEVTCGGGRLCAPRPNPPQATPPPDPRVSQVPQPPQESTPCRDTGLITLAWASIEMALPTTTPIKVPRNPTPFTTVPRTPAISYATVRAHPLPSTKKATTLHHATKTTT